MFSPTPGAFDEFRPILQPFLSNSLGLTQNALTALAEKMTDAIYAEISRACDANTLSLDPLARFIEGLRTDHVTRIYTTNYDDFPLQAVPNLYTGFDPIPRTGPKRLEIDGFWADEDSLRSFTCTARSIWALRRRTATSASCYGSMTVPSRCIPRSRAARCRPAWMELPYCGRRS